MKNEKGITLTSLIIYVVVLFVIIVMLGVIRNNFQNSINDVSEGSSIESEFNKFNIYFAKDAKLEGNKAQINANNEIVFSSGNTYGYNNVSKSVYLLNDRQQITLLKDISSCIFTIDTSTGKTVITVTIEFSGNTNNTITKEKISGIRFIISLIFSIEIFNSFLSIPFLISSIIAFSSYFKIFLSVFKET